MYQKNNEKFIAFITTIAGLGLIVENFLMGWEYWVPVTTLIGVLSRDPQEQPV